MSTVAIRPAPDRDSGRVALADVAADDVVWEGAPHPAGPGSRPAADASPVDALIGLLESADQIMSAAIRVLRASRGTGAAERRSGLPIERLLSLATGRTGTDIRFLSKAERTLTHMPAIDQAFADGRLSWSQVRGIITAGKGLRVAQTAELDRELGAEVGQGEPDRIVQRAFGWADLIMTEGDVEQPEADPGDRKSFRIQPDLFGGAAYYGYDRLGAVCAIWEAANAAADPPAKPDRVRTDTDGNPVPAELLPATARQAQLAEGLRRVADTYLAGQPPRPEDHRRQATDAEQPSADSGQDPTAPKTRWSAGRARIAITLIIDHTDLLGATGRALIRHNGGPIRLTRLTTDRLLCNPQLSTIITDDGRPIAVGDATAPITRRHYRTLEAIDRGCRMPGCNAPPQHCDAHHLIPRSRGGPTSTDNLILLCRDCHSRLHTHHLDLTADRNSRAVTLTLPDGHTYISLPA